MTPVMRKFMQIVSDTSRLPEQRFKQSTASRKSGKNHC